MTALEPGDQVDLLLELLALPLSAERYYGPNAALRAALAAGANTWQMVHREADANRPMLQLPDGTMVRGWPLTVPVGASREIAFTLHGGLGWIPVRLTGLAQPNAAELFRVMAAPMRLKIISCLCDGEKNVTYLLSKIATTQPNMSQHLNTLYKAGVLAKRRDGVQIYYRIANQQIVNLCKVVCMQVEAASPTAS